MPRLRTDDAKVAAFPFHPSPNSTELLPRLMNLWSGVIDWKMKFKERVASSKAIYESKFRFAY